MINEIKEYLEKNATNNYKEFSSKLIKTKYPILGIRTPILRDLAKKIVNDNYKLFLEENDYSYYELVLLEAFVIGKAKMNNEELFYYLDRFIPLIDNWAVHDGLVSSLKITKKIQDEMLKYLNKYITSKKEYEVRFVALMLMSYYLEDKYINIAFEIINKLYLVDYYSKMGVAWFLATAAINYPDLVYNYLNYSRDIELKRMTVRKLRDSFRIDDKYKEMILKTIRS